MLKPMLSRVKVLFFLVRSLAFLEQLLLLLLSEGFAVESHEFLLQFFDLLLLHLFVVYAEVGLLLNQGDFFIVKRCFELYFYICLYYTYLVFRFCLNNINEEILALVVDINRIPLHQARIISELMLQSAKLG
jgi:hypothetical protein